MSAVDHPAETHSSPVDYIYMTIEIGRAQACTLLLLLAAGCGGAALEEATGEGEAVLLHMADQGHGTAAQLAGHLAWLASNSLNKPGRVGAPRRHEY